MSKDKMRYQEPGSKIFISALPTDVRENEISDLFQKTVGPLKDSFLIYNSEGRSKGMAVVIFQRPGDAAVARTKYNGKIVDGRRTLKVEIIVDDIDVAPSPPIPLAPSLLDRIGVKRSTEAIPIDSTTVNTAKISTTSAKHLVSPKHPNRPITHTVPLQRARQKKGPKRIKKSLAQLDKEIEDYRASAEMFVAGVMNGESL